MRLLHVAMIAGSIALAQAQGPPVHGMGWGGMRFMGTEGMHPGKVVTGAPFSGKQVTTETQTLANGSHISRTITAQYYRDAQGRMRVERTVPAGPGDSSATKTMVEIFDPVAGAGYMLDPTAQTAVKMTLPSRPASTTSAETSSATTSTTSGTSTAAGTHQGWHGNTTDQVAETKLGTQTLHGVSVTGTQTTRTIPVNAIGNDQALTITSERWYSPDLQITVMSKRSDPRMGDVTSEFQDIARTTPDASLFSVPASYTVTTRQAMRHGGHMPPPGEATNEQ